MTELALREPNRVVCRDRRTAHYILKRSLDIVIAVVLLAVLAPLFLIVAVLIKLETPGPVIFSQERVGSRRRRSGDTTSWELCTFRLYKFRSMVHDADPSLHVEHVRAFVEGRLQAADGNARFKLKNDPRVTRVGALIRRTSIDELPQLINVVAGQMSLVGPRPVPVYEVERYRPEDHRRFGALPGITGLWQVNGRSSLAYHEMIELDVLYANNQSLLLDLKILLRTIPLVLGGADAA